MASATLLDGVRVLEFGQIAAGPFCGSLLADLGADVVKVERPDGGDGMRDWPPYATNERNDSFSENFASLNRNKRSLTVDLKDAGAVIRLRRLCAAADVVVENFRPGVLARLGLGHEALRTDNPRLVYCSISGYGQSGPYAAKGAFDVTVQAMSGLMSVTGNEGEAPVKCGVPVGDFCAGLYAAYSIAAALLARGRSGEGAVIDCSMLGSLIGVAALQTSEFFGTGTTPRALGSAHPRNAPYQAFPAADRPFVIAAGNGKLWREVCEAVGLPELADDPRFATQALRARNQKELVAVLVPRFRERTAEAWLREMDRRGVPCSPINTYADILADPHVGHLGLVRDLTLPNGVTTRTTAFPVAIAGHDFAIRRPPPPLGADTDAVYSEWLDHDA
ncbi:CaiB/BaiF CoA transferase family protein [Azospirillum sp. ST 5-10]|uniref:CaiB/BaiF CoA transferase family protein n=1 Tax=unclassified Azospirillum TaxID=2630922 RepID=UPI003F4A020C